METNLLQTIFDWSAVLFTLVAIPYFLGMVVKGVIKIFNRPKSKYKYTYEVIKNKKK